MAKTAGGLRGSNMQHYRRSRIRYEEEMKAALGSGTIRNVDTNILKNLRDAGLGGPGRIVRNSMEYGYGIESYTVETAARASIARKYMKQIEEELKRRR